MFYSATATGTCTCTCADYISVTSTGSCFILIGNGYFLPPAESQKLLVKTDENDSAEQKEETGDWISSVPRRDDWNSRDPKHST